MLDSGGASKSTPLSLQDNKFHRRTSVPAIDNPYYVKTTGNGYNPCSLGNSAHGLRPSDYSVLPNCVGYAWGRFHEILADPNYLKNIYSRKMNSNSFKFITLFEIDKTLNVEQFVREVIY